MEKIEKFLNEEKPYSFLTLEYNEKENTMKFVFCNSDKTFDFCKNRIDINNVSHIIFKKQKLNKKEIKELIKILN